MIENSDFVVARHVYADKNVTKYTINNKQATREEVVKLLKSHGVDLDNNRFLILQGEVEQIAMMKPKAQNKNETGLLEYLEEIIGSDQYVEAIENASRELETLSEEKRTKLDRLKVAKIEKDNLEASRNQAIDYLNKNKELCDKRSILHQILKQRIISKNKSTIEKEKELEEELMNIKTKIEELESQSKSSNYENEKKMIKKVQQEYDKVKEECRQIERIDIECRNSSKQIKKKLKDAQKTIEKETNKVSEYEKERESIEENIKYYNEMIEKFEEDIKFENEALGRLYENSREELKPLQDLLSQKQKELMPYKEKENEAQSKLDLAIEEKKLLEERFSAAQEELESSKASLSEKRELIEYLQETKIPELENEYSSLKAKKKEIGDNVEQLKNKKNTLLKEVEHHSNKVEEISSSLENAESRGTLLDKLMKAKDSGLIEGIHGRLGDLGTIDSKYNVAISVACSALNHIVVDDAKSGQKCVEYLRKNNLGRATFIMLDKMTAFSNRSREPIDIPKGSLRLFDLVKKDDPIYDGAFYYALRDTLVCKDAQTATKISFGGNKRWRVVTLDGQLFEKSGTMSGGGKIRSTASMKNSGTVDSATQARELQEHKKLLKEAQDSLKEVENELESKERELDEVVRNLERVKTEIQKANLELDTSLVDCEELEKRLKELETEAKMSKEEKLNIKKKEEIIEEYKLNLDNIKKEAMSLEREIKKIQSDIENVGGHEVSEQKRKIESLTQSLEEFNSSLAKSNSKSESLAKSIRKSTKLIQDTKHAYDELMKKREEVKESLKKNEVEATELLDRQAQLEEQLTKMKEEIQQKEEEVKHINDELNELKQRELELSSNLKNIKKSMKEFEQKIKKHDQEIEDLNRKKDQWKIDDDDMEVSVPILSEEELEKVDWDKLQIQIQTLEQELEKKKPNLSCIKEYNEKLSIFNEKQSEYDEINEKCEKKRQEYEDLRIKRLHQFTEGLSKISLKLKEMYRMITLGGDADLELNDSSDPFSEGITFSVRPPGKSWKNIQNLSGGEKTLSSLSLVFALHYYKPTPIYVMDEIDAALDFKNVSIVANYIKERTKNAQFIIISLRNYMFELSDRLVGIYKTNNTTKSVTINPKSFSLGTKKTSKDEEDVKS